MPCFRGVTKIPCNRINMKRGQGSFIEISTAEAGTVQLEFRDLSRSTKDYKFEVICFKGRVCVYVCVSSFVYVYVYVHMCICVCLCMCMCIHVYVYGLFVLYVCVSVCLSICV